MSVAPYIRPIRTAGTFYTFPSASEDHPIFGGETKKTIMSYFACLNLPPIIRPTSDDQNTVQTDANPGAYHTVTGTNWNKMWAEWFQNYVLNREKMITSTGDYNADEVRTISERNFWFALKNTGAIRWREALPTEVSSLSKGKRFVEEDSATNGYKRVVQYIGEIDIFNHMRHYGNSYSEVYIHVPTKDGHTPLVLFKCIEDDNYEPNMYFQNDPDEATDREYLYGRHYDDLHPAGLNIEAFFDSDVSAYDDDNLYLLEKMNEDGDYENGWWFPNPMLNSYFTEPVTFEDPTNDDLRITGQGGGKDTVVTLKRSRLDGATIDFDLDSYRPATENAAVQSWTDFNTLPESSSFEFNAVLIYYDVFDESQPENRVTNLYGILFLDNVEQYSTGGGYIPSFQKYRPNRITGDNGNAYGLKVNLKFDISTDDAKVETAINEYNTYSMHLFIDALNELRRAYSILTDNQDEITRLTEKMDELQTLVLTVENYRKLESQITEVVETLEENNALITTAADIAKLVEKIHQEVLDIYAGRTSINVAYNLDVIRQGDGIQVDRTIPNQVTLRNTRQAYNTPVQVSVLDEWEQNEVSWYYTAELLQGANYLRVQDEEAYTSDRHMVIFLDDTKTAWKKGQSYKISFGSEYSLEGPNANYSLYLYTDGRDTLLNGTAYSKEVASIPYSTFLTAGGSPIIEVICIDPATMTFVVDITRNITA